MVSPTVHRRCFLAGAAAATSLPAFPVLADEVVDLEWSDLLPEGSPPVLPAIPGLVDHDGPDMSAQQPASTGRRTDWNGRIVRLPGFVVPIDQTSAGVTAFILVPYVGACIHVPPPPANQLVFVTSPEPYPSTGLFEAVNVTGMFGTASTHTQLAQIGYALSAEKIEPFRF